MCYWRVDPFILHPLDNYDDSIYHDDDDDNGDDDDDDDDDDDEIGPVWQGKLDRGWEAPPQSRLLGEALQTFQSIFFLKLFS